DGPDGRVHRGAVALGAPARGRRLPADLGRSPRAPRARPAHREGRSVHGDEGAHRRLRARAGEGQEGGGRARRALPPDRGRRRERSASGPRPAGPGGAPVIYGKTVADYLRFQRLPLVLLAGVGLLRLVLSLGGLPTDVVRFLS